MHMILPTGSCFDDAIEFIGYAISKHPSLADKDFIFLVHAICKDAGGKEYAHGWVEMGDMVVFSGVMDGEKQYFVVHDKEYYEKMRVGEFTRYTIEEMARKNLETVSYGPWEEKYIALCGANGTEGMAELHAVSIGKIVTEKKEK